MPFKRITKSSQSRVSKRGFKRRRTTGIGVKSFNTIKRHAPTILKFANAFWCKQPFPDRYDTWLSYANNGYTALGASSVSFGQGLSTPVFPSTQNNGLGGIPNPFVSIATADCAGLKNILVNSSTSSGLYTTGIVLGVKIELVIMPQGSGDTLVAAMAPVTGGSTYGNIIPITQGPNSISKVCEFSVPSGSNTLSNYFSLPGLAGMSTKEYIANPSNYFTYAAVPTNAWVAQVFWKTSDTAITSYPVTYQLRAMYHCLFFNRADTALIDN
jgi:hypothetical protein